MCRNRRAIAGLVALLVVAGAVYARGVHARANYDEGVYLASLDALDHGQSLGADVYASQPPGFYVLLQALSLLPGDGVTGVRVSLLLVALVGLVAAYAVGCRLSGTWGGLGSAALLAVTAPYPVQAPRVQADTLSIVLSLAAVAVLVHAGASYWRTGLAGTLAGAALSVKLLALPVVVPLAVLLIARRSLKLAAALAVGAVAVWIALAIAFAGALGELWKSAILDHRDTGGLGPTVADNADRILLHPLDWKTPGAVLVVAGFACALAYARRVELLALGLWAVASAVFLISLQPLFDHHLVLIATVLAVPAGAGLGAALQTMHYPARLLTAGVLALMLLAAGFQEQRRLARQGGDPPGVRWAARELRATTEPDELVATDLPIVAYLGDRRVPGQLVDSSYVRLGTGSLSEAEILDTLERDSIRVIVAGRAYLERPALLAALRARYPERLERDGVTVFRAP